MEDSSRKPEIVFQLSKEEIEKIKAEEILRIQLKNELSPKEKKNKTLSFFNSAFGLFLLSAVFITGLGSYITRKFQEKDTEAMLRKEAFKHFIELDYRIAQINLMLKGIDEHPQDAFGRSYYLTGIIQADNGKDFHPVINDYRNISMFELISWFDYNYKLKETKLSTDANNGIANIFELKDDKGVWDTKAMSQRMKLFQEYLKQLKEELKP